MATKKSISLIAAVLGTGLVIAGCGNSEGDSPDAAPPGGDVSLSFGHVLAETQPWHTCGALPFETEVEEAGVGLEIELYPAGQTHNSTAEQLDALDAGNLDITWASPAQLATRLPDLEVLDAVYAFRDVNHMNQFAESDVAQNLWDDLLDEGNLRVLGIGYYGTRHVTANHPVSTPDDLSGVQMRVLDAPLWTANGEALGAQPTSVPFAELYLALQQGVADAQENPLPVIDAEGFHEVQDYVNLTGHVVATLAVVIAEDSWKGLSEDQQDTLLNAGSNLAQNVTECTLENEDELLEAWSGETADIEIHDDVDVEAFRENAENILLPRYEDSWANIYREIQALN